MTQIQNTLTTIENQRDSVWYGWSGGGRKTVKISLSCMTECMNGHKGIFK